MANNNFDHQVTVGINVDDSAVRKAFFPTSYDMTITQKLEQDPSMKKGVFLGNYEQVVTQRLVVDKSSFGKGMYLGDHTATTYLHLDDSAYRAQMARINTHSWPSNVVVDLNMRTSGEGAVARAVAMFGALANSEYFVDAQWNGRPVLDGLRQMQAECTNLSQVLAYLDRAMKNGDTTANKMGMDLRKTLNMQAALADAQKTVERIQSSMPKKKFEELQDTVRWQNLMSTIGQGSVIAAHNDMSAMIGWNQYWAANKMEHQLRMIEAEQKGFGAYGNKKAYAAAEGRYRKAINDYNGILQGVRENIGTGDTASVVASLAEKKDALDKLKKSIQDYESKLKIANSERFKFVEAKQITQAVDEIDKLNGRLDMLQSKLKGSGARAAKRNEMLAPLTSAIQGRITALAGGRDAFLSEMSTAVVQDAITLANHRVNKYLDGKTSGADFDKLSEKANKLWHKVGPEIGELNWMKRLGEETPVASRAIETLTQRVRDMFAAMKSGDATKLQKAISDLEASRVSSKASLALEKKFGSDIAMQQAAVISTLRSRLESERDALSAVAKEYGAVIASLQDKMHKFDFVRWRQNASTGFDSYGGSWRGKLDAAGAQLGYAIGRQQGLYADRYDINQRLQDHRGLQSEAASIIENRQRLNVETERTIQLQSQLNGLMSQFASLGGSDYAKVVSMLKSASGSLDAARSAKSGKEAGLRNKEAEGAINAAQKYAEQAQAIKAVRESLTSLENVKSNVFANRDVFSKAEWEQYINAINEARAALARLKAAQAGDKSTAYRALGINGGSQVVQTNVGSYSSELIKSNIAIENARRAQESLVKTTSERAQQRAEEEALAQKKASEAAAEYNRHLQEMASRHRQNQGLVSQLGQEIMMAYSIQSVKQFLSNIVEVGGQFEQQRMSIAAILGDVSQANMLFEQVKRLGLNSPFSTLELDSYVKQLSAFDVEYNQLFDKMKRLADISAGTGTDMSRIILAYGHVKASGYLEGMQRRQFTNANINIVKGLQDLYKERDGKELSRKDIYDMIKKKEVTFEDVDATLMKLAEPGGKFYNMQEVMANTTKGVWKNVRDAFNHMLLALNTQFGDQIVGVGKMTMGLMTTFSKLSPYILNTALAFTALKGSMAIWARTNGNAQAAAVRNIVNTNKERVAILEKALAYRTLSQEESNALNRGKKGAFFSHMFYGGANAKNDVLSMMNGGRVGVKDARAMMLGGLIKPEEIQKANKYLYNAINANTKYARTWNTVLYSANRAIGGIKLGLQSLWATMWPLLALEAVVGTFTYFYNKDKEEKEKAKEYTDQYRSSVEKLRDDLESIANVDYGKLEKGELLEAEIEDINIFQNDLESCSGLLDEIYAKDESGNFLLPAEERATRVRDLIAEAKEASEKVSPDGMTAAFDQMFDNTSAKSVSGDLFDHDMKSQLDYFKDAYTEMISVTNKFSEANGIYMSKYFESLSNGVREMDRYRDANGKLNANLSDQFRDLVLLGKISSVDLEKNLPSSMRGGSAANSLKEFVQRVEVIKEQAVEAFAKAPYEIKNKLGNDKAFREAFYKYLTVDKGYVKEQAQMITEIMSAQFTGNPIKLPMTVDTDDLKRQIEDGMGDWKLGLGSMGFSSADFTEALAGDNVSIKQARAKLQKVYDGLDDEWKDITRTWKYLSVPLGIQFDIQSADVSSINELIGSLGGTSLPGNGVWKPEYQKGQRQALTDLLQQAVNNIVARQEGLRAQQLGLLDAPGSGKKNGSGSGKKEDTELKKQQKRAKQLQDVAKVYNDYAKVYGEAQAKVMMLEDKELSGIYKEFFGDKNPISKEGVEKAQKQFLEGIKAFENGSEERKGFWYDMWRRWKETGLENAKEDIEEMISAVEKELDARRNRINLYEKMFDATYDTNIAKQFAFLGGTPDTDLTKLYVKDKTLVAIEDFNKKMEKLKDTMNVNGNAYTYEQLLGFSAERLKTVPEEVRKAFDETKKAVDDEQREQYEQIIGIVEQYQSVYDKIVKARGEVLRNASMIDVAIGKKMISSEYGDLLKRRISAQQNLEELKESLSYIQLMDNALSMNDEQIGSISMQLKTSLHDAWMTGTITAQQYGEELGKIAEIEKKLRTETTRNAANRATGAVLGFFTDRKGWKGSGYRRAITHEGRSAEEYRLASLAEIAQRRYEQGVKSYDAGAITKEELEALADRAKEASDSLQNIKLEVDWFESKQEGLQKFGKAMTGATAAVEGLQQAFKSVSETFYAFGNKDMGRKFEYISDGIGAVGEMLSPVSNVVQSMLNGDVGGIVKNLITAPIDIFAAPIKAFAALHDKRKQHEIDDYKQDIANLESSMKAIERRLNREHSNQINAYKEELANLVEQKKTQEAMRDAEEDKKNSDADALRSYQESVDELDDKIKYYTRDILKNLYDIDFSDWGNQLGDAIWQAFESGNDAAIAWKQKTGDIMRQVANKFMNTKLIQPLFDKLEEEAFKGLDFNGDITEDKIQDAILRMGNLMDSEMPNIINAMGLWNDKINDKYAYSSNADSSSGLSKIGQNITEDTASVISSLVNSIHYDTSAMRVIADSQLQKLDAIESHTKVVADAITALVSPSGATAMSVRIV